MMKNSDLLNFIAEPSRYNTKFFPAEDNPIITICGKGFVSREVGSQKDIRISANFSSFDYPNLYSLFCKLMVAIEGHSCVEVDYDTPKEHYEVDSYNWSVMESMNINPETTLLIVVDNNFNIYDPNLRDLCEKDKRSENDRNYQINPKNLNYVFIDHHLYERKCGVCPYASNSAMIYKNFNAITKALSKIIANKQIDNVGVLFHTDLDGIGAGLMILKMLEIIKKERAPRESDINDIGLAFVLGEYGDISGDKEEIALSVFNQRGNKRDGVLNKMKCMAKNLGRFMKAIRPVIDCKVHLRPGMHDVELMERFNELKIKYGIGYLDVLNAYLKIKAFFNTAPSINSLSIMCLISQMVQDPINRIIIDMVQSEIDLVTSSYLKPETPQFDAFVKFGMFEDLETDNYKPYKLLIIDSALDIGRSVMWTYTGRLKYFSNTTVDRYKYSMKDFGSELSRIYSRCENMAVYNTFSEKLSLNSTDQSAFEIAKAFGGGGHGGTESGSLGSVSVTLEDLQEHTEIVELF